MAHEIVMPSLGMFTGEGTLTRWLRPTGSPVAADEPVVEITTEKTTQELVAPVAGILHHVLPEGSTVPIQGLIGYVQADATAPVHPLDPGRPGRGNAEVSLPQVQDPETPGRQEEEVARGNPLAAPRPSGAAPAPSGVEGLRVSPIARRLAADNGIELTALVGTGPGGRIVEADVTAAIERTKGAAGSTPAPSPAAPVTPSRKVRERVPLIGVRRTIAERLRASQSTVAAVTLTREVDAERFVAARARLSASLGSVPYDALFVKILAGALRARPTFNAVIEEGAILVLDEINVGFAVAVPSGLVVPVVREADHRSLADVSEAVQQFSQRARANRLTFDDLSGGTVTITNLGAQGVDAFTPIINPPQAAILGIGRIRERPVARAGQLVLGTTVVLSLTFDHRVADGVPAAHLLDDVARLMNDERLLGNLG